MSKDTFSRYLVVGITSMIIGQAFLNISSLIGLFPLTGVPLVFVSHGGTSLLVTLGAVGIVLGVSRTKKNVY
jgi:cell division protein FtsW